jgi:hypothetical protein
MTTDTSTANTATTYPQPLRLYHPSGSGTGSAMQLEPRFSSAGEDRYNCFFLEMAAQKTTGRQEDGNRVHATFDWKAKLAVKLDFTDICELLTVLEGQSEKVGGSHNGLYHQNGSTSTIITFQKSEKGGYVIGLSRKDAADGEARRVCMVLSTAEAIGLRSIFQGSLFFLAFHQHLFGSR